MSVSSQTQVPVHGGQMRQIAERYGVSADLLLDFSANINPDGPPPSAIAAMQQALSKPATIAAYPDLELTELKQTIAECVRLRRENISIANGFVPGLEAVLRSLKIRRCLLPVPCFSEYRRTLENSDITIEPYLLSPDNSFVYEPDAMLVSLLANSCDAILLANPQNPSGVLCESSKMRQLVELAAQHGITVLLDEAFIDYRQDDSLTPYTTEQTNLIVFRSVTKFFAIPGLRVSYVVCNAALASVMSRHIAPWPVTSLASDAVCAALRDERYAETSKLMNEQRHAWLKRQIERLQIESYPSSTNFLLLKFAANVDVRLLWEKMILDRQIVLRSCENFEGLTPGHLRIAVRSEAENKRLIQGLEQTLAEMR